MQRSNQKYYRQYILLDRIMFRIKLLSKLEIVLLWSIFGCHIDAAKQLRALNFELAVIDQLFSEILVAYN